MLLAPDYAEFKSLCGLDEDFDIGKDRIFVVHQLGELALDIDDYETAFFGVEHTSFKLLCEWAGLATVHIVRQSNRL